MADVIKVQDMFTGLALNVTINGRYPTVNDGGYAWQVDGNGTALGDGAGNVKFSENGFIKIRTLQENPVAVRTIFNDGGQADGFILCIGDSQGAVYPKWGYGAKFERAAGLVRMYRFDSFIAVKIGSDIPYTFPSGDFTAVFQRSSNSFSASVNGEEVGTFSDATYAPNGTRSRHGLIPQPWVSGTGRMRSYEVLDSVTLTPTEAPPHNIVRVW